jgi:branched-chain amino acid transport system permease protein
VVHAMLRADAAALSGDENRESVSVRRSSRATLAGLGLAIAVVAVLAVLPFGAGESVTNQITQLFILLLLAVGWNLLAGYGGMVSIGQQGFVGLGSYAILYLAQHGVLSWYAVPIAVVFAAAVSIPISFLAFRLRGGYFAIGTWVIAEVFRLVVAQVQSLGGGAGASLNDLSNYDPVFRDHVTYWVGLALVVLTLLAAGALLRSRVGLALMSVRDDDRAAEASGVKVVRTKRMVYVLSAAVCASAGTLLILSNLEVQPDASFSVQYSAFMIFMVLVGGMGSFEGPIVGALVFFGLQQLLSSYGVWYLVIVGTVAVAVTLWLPAGIWGTIDPRHRRSIVPLRHRVSFGGQDAVVPRGRHSAGREAWTSKLGQLGRRP